MRKVLVLAVDRDNDFGGKGKVQTPVVGINRCKEAAAALGIADPEDSDTNALYAAIKVCLEIRDDGGDAEVALICGDETVGHRSDERLVKEFESILERVNPDGIVLVGDGAEDEYVYPIISSRARVDSVRKVYIRQVPGIEGSFYIISRMLADPGKRKRFIAPIGMLVMLISLFFIMVALGELHVPKVHVIVETLLICRAVGELGVRVEPLDCLRHDVGGGVTYYVQLLLLGTLAGMTVVVDHFHFNYSCILLIF